MAFSIYIVTLSCEHKDVSGMRTERKQRLIARRCIDEMIKRGVLVEQVNPARPEQKGYSFTKACFIKPPLEQCTRVLGFIKADFPNSFDTICVNCSSGERKKVSRSMALLEGHLYSAISREIKYDKRPLIEEVLIIALTKREASHIIKDLSISGYWPLDRKVHINASSLSRII